MFYTDVLPNGIRVITEEMPEVYSVTAGIWVGTGSAYETPESAGVSHFLEHMLFKGTERRSYTEIAEIMERVGGQMNAFTSKEYTCFYIKALSENLDLGLDVLSDMYLNSVFAESEYQKEKSVILEEINMYLDSPEDMTADLFNAVIMPEHTYGKPIIGTVESVSNMTREDIVRYHHQAYAADQTIVVVAGSVKHDEVVKKVEKYMGAHGGSWQKPQLTEPQYKAGQGFAKKDIEQVHVMLGVPGVSGLHPDNYKLSMMTYVLGGGMCSRLFQEVREKRGLTYNVYSYNGGSSKGGLIYSYGSTSPKNVSELVKVIGCEMAKLIAYGITDDELFRAQAQMKCGLLMGLENTGNVMARLGRSQSSFGLVRDIDTIVNDIMAVTKDDVQRVAAEYLTADRLVLAQVGVEETAVDLQSLLQC
ncbi:MAG: M16 family metallopeptidase [Bacillota bacterium]|jgi:predicted Zn-dependent peptidase